MITKTIKYAHHLKEVAFELYANPLKIGKMSFTPIQQIYILGYMNGPRSLVDLVSWAKTSIRKNISMDIAEILVQTILEHNSAKDISEFKITDMNLIGEQGGDLVVNAHGVKMVFNNHQERDMLNIVEMHPGGPTKYLYQYLRQEMYNVNPKRQLTCKQQWAAFNIATEFIRMHGGVSDWSNEQYIAPYIPAVAWKMGLVCVATAVFGLWLWVFRDIDSFGIHSIVMCFCVLCGWVPLIESGSWFRYMKENPDYKPNRLADETKATAKERLARLVERNRNSTRVH